MKKISWVADGVEYEMQIPDNIKSHPLPDEAVTATLNVLSAAIIHIIAARTMKKREADLMLAETLKIVGLLRVELGFDVDDGSESFD